MNNDQNEQQASDDTPPTWDDMRTARLMVVDDAYEKLAVYAGADGHIVIMSQQDGDDEPSYTSIHCRSLDALEAAIRFVRPEAEKENERFEARLDAIEIEYQRHVRAQGSEG